MKKENKAMKEMKEKIYDARTGMEYILIGDYYLPALKLPQTRPGIIDFFFHRLFSFFITIKILYK